MPHALPGGCGGPPQQVGCGWGASPGTGGAAPPRWVCMWPASWAGVLQCTLHSLHRMRSARGAWSPWSFTAWMRRYAAVVKPIGGVDRDGGVGGQPGGDPRDGAVLLRPGTPSSDSPDLLPPHPWEPGANYSAGAGGAQPLPQLRAWVHGATASQPGYPQNLFSVARGTSPRVTGH